MPHSIDLIVTLTGGLTAALIFGIFTRRLGLSPIVGYLLAGIAVGPFTPGIALHTGIAAELAEIGVILLMFGVGLHFHLDELLSVRRQALPGALIQFTATVGLGVLITRPFGWSVVAGAVFGMAVAVASTVVMLRVLGDAGALRAKAGRIAIGWTLVEDVLTVVVLVLLPVLSPASGGARPIEIALSIGVAVIKIAALVAFTGLVGRRIIPDLLRHVAATGSRELFTLAVLVIALGIAVGSALLFGASMALGAFLAGMVVGQSELSAHAAQDALPMRDAFAVLFFVSVGMLFDPARLAENAGLLAATLALILVGKPLIASLLVLALRGGARTALTVGMALAQIGEFSFILAGLAQRNGVLPERANQALVAASIVSITLNPLLIRLAEPAARLISPRRAAV